MTDKLDSNELLIEKTIAEDLVVTKYKMSAEIVNKVLQELIQQCKTETSVRDLCIQGDKKIVEHTSRQFKKEKELKKGIAFPTCISVNNCICHYSPLSSEPDYTLKDGDLVKIDLGAHIDGFIAVVAHSLIVGVEGVSGKVTGRKADVMLAAYYASEAALRLVKPGNESTLITDTITRLTSTYNCKPIEGMLSHQLKQNVLDGEKTIIQNPNEVQKKEYEKCVFEVNEVYAVDCIVSTGEGQAKELTTRVSIYKRTLDQYMLKLRTSRVFFSEVQSKHGLMAFNLRDFEDEKKAKMGVSECVKNKLIEPYQVLYEKQNELVAQFKFTVLLMPTGSHKITGLDKFPIELYESEFSIQDGELKKLLASSVNPGKKKKKAAACAGTSTTAAGDNANASTATAAANSSSSQQAGETSQ